MKANEFAVESKVISAGLPQTTTVKEKTELPLLSVLLRNRIPIFSSESVELKQSLIVEQAQAEIPEIRDRFIRQRSGFSNLLKWTNSIWIPILSTAFAGSLLAMYINWEDSQSWQFDSATLGLVATFVVFAGYLWLDAKYQGLYRQALDTRDALTERESCVWQSLPLGDYEVRVRRENWFTFVASVVEKEVPGAELCVEYCSSGRGPIFLKTRFGREMYYIGR